MAGHGAPGDDASRFLRELRQLRDGAGLGQAELAARAHYPSDFIRAAEAGPSLPDLPVLSAYVRGCGGTTEEWEERWRSLTRTPSLPVLTARHAGRSAAASAGARVGAVSPVAETPDPSVIMAALDRVAEGMASNGAETLPPAPVPTQPASTDSVAPPELAEPAAPPTAEADAKPAGWDPIRVSSAWPTLRPTSESEAEPAAAVAAAPPANGWQTTEPPVASAVSAPWDVPARPTVAPAVPPVNRAMPTVTRAAAPAHDSRPTSSRVRTVAIAAVLLCVLAVLLAIFA